MVDAHTTVGFIMTRRAVMTVFILLAFSLLSCAESQSSDPNPIVDEECQDSESPRCDSETSYKRCVLKKYTTVHCIEGQICENGACRLPMPKPACGASDLASCSDALTIKYCNDGVWAWKRCEDEEYCEGGRCVKEVVEPICAQGERSCLGSKVLQNCVDGEWRVEVCSEGEVCEDGGCVKSDLIEYVDGVWVLPLSRKPYTSLQMTHVPTVTEEALSGILNGVFNVTHFRHFKGYGLGMRVEAGEPWQLKETLAGANSPPFARRGTSLAYFWQFADPQISDVQSPSRMEGTYMTNFVVASAYRPQGHLSTHILDVHIQTAMRISDLSTRPFDFVLCSGDIADSSQKNELEWIATLIGGGVLNPDSGIKDDPIPGPNNDFADPYYAKGIGNIPYYLALGNHDILYMGFAPINDEIQEAATGNRVVDLFSFVNAFLGSHENRDSYRNGYRDASRVDAPVVAVGETPADSNRMLLGKVGALKVFMNLPGEPKNHGLDPELVERGWGYFAVYPIPGKPIKLITLDTNSGNFSEAQMDREQFEWFKAEIEKARRANELIIVHSHHSSKNLGGDVKEAEFTAAMTSYSGIILHLVGHGHGSYSRLITNYENKGYWELMASSTIDFPSQTRIIELVHEGDGIISTYVTNLDANAAPDSQVDESRLWSAARRYFSFKGDAIKKWNDEKPHRNMIIRSKVDKAIADNLDKFQWHGTIDSIETLEKFSVPHE